MPDLDAKEIEQLRSWIDEKSSLLGATNGDIKMVNTHTDTAPVSVKYSPLLRYPRGAEVYKILPKKTRVTVAAACRKNPDIWPLILTAIDNGFLTATNALSVNDSPLNLRFLLPCIPPREFGSRHVLTHAPALERVKNEIMPAVVACREAILANPSEIEPILRSYLQREGSSTVGEEKAADMTRLYALVAKALARANDNLDAAARELATTLAEEANHLLLAAVVLEFLARWKNAQPQERREI
jgi:hypothetical protein